jgi:hypothetical protein
MTVDRDLERARLHKDLVAGAITGVVFLEAIEKLDQSTKDRVDAPANLKLLTAPEVASYFKENSDCTQAYQDLLSLTYWHVGQTAAIKDANHESALQYFKQAHTASVTAGANRHRAWRAYIAASIAYLEEDLPELLANYNKLPSEDGNRPIIETFIHRLREGGAPDYRADYTKR